MQFNSPLNKQVLDVVGGEQTASGCGGGGDTQPRKPATNPLFNMPDIETKSLSHSSVGHITQRDLGVETFKRSRVIVARRYVLIFRKEQKLLSSAAYVAGISDMIKLQTAFFSVINSRKCRQ